MDEVTVRRGYNHNTISWDEAFKNLNDSIDRKIMIKHIDGFFVAHRAEKISVVQDVLNDLECKIAHLYIGIVAENPGFGNHRDDVDVWFWQNKGVTRWNVNNGDNYILNEGDLIYIPKGVDHNVSSIVARFGISMSRE